jgi:hypothetical protein
MALVVACQIVVRLRGGPELGQEDAQLLSQDPL